MSCRGCGLNTLFWQSSTTEKWGTHSALEKRSSLAIAIFSQTVTFFPIINVGFFWKSALPGDIGSTVLHWDVLTVSTLGRERRLWHLHLFIHTQCGLKGCRTYNFILRHSSLHLVEGGRRVRGKKGPFGWQLTDYVAFQDETPWSGELIFLTKPQLLAIKPSRHQNKHRPDFCPKAEMMSSLATVSCC